MLAVEYPKRILRAIQSDRESGFQNVLPLTVVSFAPGDVQFSKVVAIGVTAASEREVLGVDIGSSEDGAFWIEFLRGLVTRGLVGVELVISDAHMGLKEAIPAVLSGAN